MLLPNCQHNWRFFSHNFKCEGEVVLSDVLKFFCNCIPGQLELLSEVCKLVKLLLVMPATNAESERSFSAIQRIKTYLQSTMSQQQLNHLMLLHVHKSHTDHLNLVDVANDFISGNEHKKNAFGTEFKDSDLDFV